MGDFDAAAFDSAGFVTTAAEPPPTQGHGGRGFLADNPRKRKDTDDDALVVLLL